MPWPPYPGRERLVYAEQENRYAHKPVKDISQKTKISCPYQESNLEYPGSVYLWC